MSTDFPAPLSPARAVTWPAGTSRLTSTSARTGPKLLLTPRRLSSGTLEPAPYGGTVWSATSVPWLVVTRILSAWLLDPGGRAGALGLGDADVTGADPLVLGHRGRHVLGRHPDRRHVRRLDIGVRLRVLGGGIHQARRRRLAGP